MTSPQRAIRRGKPPQPAPEPEPVPPFVSKATEPLRLELDARRYARQYSLTVDIRAFCLAYFQAHPEQFHAPDFVAHRLLPPVEIAAPSERDVYGY